MEKKITLNFKNIVSELEDKELKICFVINRPSLFIENKQGNLYVMEDYRQGSYLDQLIKNEVKAKFNIRSVEVSKNIKDWEKKYMSISELKSFITKHI